MNCILVTGSGGLIGFESVKFFCQKKFKVIGIDNNMRQYFFGEKGSTIANVEFLKNNYPNFTNYNIDIRDFKALNNLFKSKKFDIIIHAAAQPSHDWAAREPLTDFSVNALGTLNLLECTRLYCSKNTVFIFLSTNKVYGDKPNQIKLKETETRWEFDEPKYKNGITEDMSIDQSKHSLFGASKVSADILCQEYGRYFGMKIGIFRGGCLTGPQHSAVELHGFLAYLVDCCVNRKKYIIFGYKGKQVRDNIHSYDVVNAFWNFYLNPRKGEVYNIGGCKENCISVIEAIKLTEQIVGRKMKYSYYDKNREGDHICYYSDMSKFKKHYPHWRITKNLRDIIIEIRNTKSNKE